MADLEDKPESDTPASSIEENPAPGMNFDTLLDTDSSSSPLSSNDTSSSVVQDSADSAEHIPGLERSASDHKDSTLPAPENANESQEEKADEESIKEGTGDVSQYEEEENEKSSAYISRNDHASMGLISSTNEAPGHSEEPGTIAQDDSSEENLNKLPVYLTLEGHDTARASHEDQPLETEGGRQESEHQLTDGQQESEDPTSRGEEGGLENDRDEEEGQPPKETERPDEEEGQPPEETERSGEEEGQPPEETERSGEVKKQPPEELERPVRPGEGGKQPPEEKGEGETERPVRPGEGEKQPPEEKGEGEKQPPEEKDEGETERPVREETERSGEGERQETEHPVRPGEGEKQPPEETERPVRPGEGERQPERVRSGPEGEPDRRPEPEEPERPVRPLLALVSKLHSVFRLSIPLIVLVLAFLLYMCSPTMPVTVRELKEQSNSWDSGRWLNVLVTGKYGTGKHTLIDSLLGRQTYRDNCAKEEHFSVCNATVNDVLVRVTFWESTNAKDTAYRKEMGERISDSDLVIHTMRMDDQRLRPEDKVILQGLSKLFGSILWDKGMFVLTFANKVSYVDKHNKMMQSHEYLVKRAKQLKGHITEILTQEGVRGGVLKYIPLVPAGHHSESRLFADREPWLSDLVKCMILRLKSDVRAGLWKAVGNHIEFSKYFSEFSPIECCQFRKSC